MTDISLRSSAARRRRELTIWFCITGVLVIGFIISVMIFFVHQQMREQWMGVSLEEVATVINESILAGNDRKLDQLNSAELAKIWQAVAKFKGVQAGAFFDSKMLLLWASSSQVRLTDKERTIFQTLLAGSSNSRIMDEYTFRLTGGGSLFGDKTKPVGGLIPLRDNSGQALGMLKLLRNNDFVLQSVKITVLRLLAYLVVGNLLLFGALFYILRRGFKTIERQEDELNKQIQRLSNMLLVNTNMQRNMKTASRRAVELNEHFLRRVGSDLHDGPAQLIGYSVMRLDRVSKDERSKELSEEFHVVKEALDSALKEIRDISSGLVLPELEDMSLLQALKKVVTRNSVNSDTKVIEYYKDLPDEIPLPIKICVYRFVQEGLNNANRHGKAEKCRVTAYVKDDMLHLSLKDNGVGFRKSNLSTEGGHLGLMGLKDRIESLGGTFSINSKLGVGTAIKASIALTDEIWPYQE